MDDLLLTELLSELDQRAAKLTEYLGACRDAPTVDEVHDLRVAIRRYLAVVATYKLLAKERVAPRSTRSTLKRILDSYDDLRNLDVMIADLSAEKDLFNENSPYFLDLIQKGQLARGSEIASITEKHFRAASELIAKTRVRCAKNLVGVTEKRILRTLDASFKPCQKLAAKVDPNQPETLHLLRVAFKKFRYSMEVFSKHLPQPPEDLFQRMKAFQTSLGQVQDASVLIQSMAEFESTHPGCLKPAERSFAEERLRVRVSAFMVLLPDLGSIWRKDKNHPASWIDQPTEMDVRGFIEKLKG